MALLVIKSVKVCDGNRNVFPFDVASGAYQCRFMPNPLGVTDKIFLEVVCGLDDLASAQLKYSLTIQNQTGDYSFATSDKYNMLFYREADSDLPVYLPFELMNFRNLGECLDARMRLDVQFAKIINGASRPFEFPTIHGIY